MIFKALVVSGVTWAVTGTLLRLWAAMQDDRTAVDLALGPTYFAAKHRLVSLLAILKAVSMFATGGILVFMAARYVWNLST